MTTILQNFLLKNTISAASVLPLTHVTQAFHIRSFLNIERIVTTPCDVFKGEDLNYFFVGRPAYKRTISEVAEFWELPMCFIVDFGAVPSIKRMFPFDSGGFSRGKMPGFTSMMNLADFEVEPTEDSVSRLIGAFFGSRDAYFQMKGLDATDFERAHSLSALDAEIHALQRLSRHSPSNSDDRTFTIEVQGDQDMPLDSKSLLAVVAPVNYLDSEEFIKKVEDDWKAEILAYDVHPINSNYYHASIYSEVKYFLKQKGLLK